MKKLKIGIIVNGNFVDKYTYQLARWIKSNNKKLVSTSFISIEKKKDLNFINKKILKKIDLRKVIKNKIIIQK